MHRQSLGSPASKHHNHGALKEETPAVEDQVSSLIDAGEDKPQKPHKSIPKPETFVHSIPLLILLCFLVLYLSSHDPLQLDFTETIDDMGRVLDIKKGDVLAIRSLRNLQEIGKRVPEYRLHRKIGDLESAF